MWGIRHILILFFTWACIITKVHAQDTTTACKAVEVNDLERIIISQYINSCHKDHWFVNNKGVVKIVKFVNDEGRRAWYMSVLIDDRYKDNPPLEYVIFEGDIVLVYGGSKNMLPNKTIPTPELIKCLEEVIEDRLYIRPPKQARHGVIFGKKIKLIERSCIGDCFNGLVVIFHEDGTFERKRVY
jgi:hypothetical protein